MTAPSQDKAFKTSLRDLVQRRLYVMAEELCLNHLRSNPDDLDVQAVLASIYFEVMDFGQSLAIYERLIREKPDHLDLYRVAAQSALRAGKVDKALECAKAFHKAAGDTSDSLTLLADIYERNNRVDEAEEILEKFGADVEDRPALDFFRSRILVQRKKYDEAIDLIMRVLRQEPYSSSDKILGQFWFQLSKIRDRMGEYDLAWEAAESAHATEKTHWNQGVYEERVSKMIQVLDKEAIASLARASDSEQRPVFIVGNPRSGTSLLEQILGMHPAIENAGEMSVTSLMANRLGPMTDSYLEWPSTLFDMRVDDANKLVDMYAEATSFACPGAEVVTNKALLLQEHLGFLSLLFTRGKAINLRRHPLDNCVSCYMSPLTQSGHHYAASLDSLAKTWIGRRRLQDHWPTVVDMPILELHYEELVVNQERETRRLLEFLDVSWEDKCLEFHTSKQVARTISYDQVNRKMYNTSSGRWRNYEKHLGPLIDRLGDYL